MCGEERSIGWMMGVAVEVGIERKVRRGRGRLGVIISSTDCGVRICFCVSGDVPLLGGRKMVKRRV
jgi:hypothetical protein